MEVKEVREVKAIFGPHALKGQKLLAQGNALGLWALAWRPVRAKALKNT